MRALVTGVTGFVGGHLAEYLLERGYHVAGCSRSGTWPRQLRHLQEPVDLVRCDLTVFDATRRWLQSGEYDEVYHLAANANPRAYRDDPEAAIAEQLSVTKNLLESIVHPAKMLFVSSSYVYGQASENPVSVNAAIDTSHPYAQAKWLAEQLCVAKAAESAIPIVRVRPFNHTGPRQSSNYIIPDWIEQISQNSTVIRVGNLHIRRDYTDVGDVVRGYHELVRTAQSGTVYNLGSGTSWSGQEILELIRQETGADFDVEVDSGKIRPGESQEIVADSKPLRELTGWEPRIGLADTIRAVWHYQQKNEKRDSP